MSVTALVCWEAIEAYIHKHDDDGVYHDDDCGPPKEHSVLRSGISRLSAAKKF